MLQRRSRVATASYSADRSNGFAQSTVADFASLARVTSTGRPVQAVVFDLLFTLVQPGSYPNRLSKMDWLANLLDVDVDALRTRWQCSEPVLEAGEAPSGPDGTGPELAWVRNVTVELGAAVSDATLSQIESDWDLTRRSVLLDPPATSLETLNTLRQQGLRLGLLSNTHGLELKSWKASPLAQFFDAVVLSHEAGFCKPHPMSYATVLERLRVPAAVAAYVGDGSSNELAGAARAGFRFVILADEAARRLAPNDLPRLRAQATASVRSLSELPDLLLP